MRFVIIILLPCLLTGCRESNRPTTNAGANQSYASFKDFMNGYYKAFLKGEPYDLFSADFDGALDRIEKSGDKELYKTFIEAIGRLDVELRHKIENQASLQANEIFSMSAIRFAAACKILSRQWLPTTKPESINLLTKKGNDEKYLEKSHRWIRDVVQVCDMKLIMMLDDINKPCEYQALIATIADQIIIQRLMSGGTESKPALVPFVTSRSATISKVTDKAYLHSSSVKPLAARLMLLYSQVFNNPNITVEHLLEDLIRPTNAVFAGALDGQLI